MADLNQVVELNPFMDNRRAHRCPINTGIRPDLHIVLDPHVSDLRNLVINAVFVGSESETIGPDNRSRMNRHPVTDFAGLINLHARKQRHVVTQTHPIAQIHLRIDLAPVSDFHALFDHRIVANIHLFAHLYRLMNRCQLADPLLLRLVCDIQLQ